MADETIRYGNDHTFRAGMRVMWVRHHACAGASRCSRDGDEAHERQPEVKEAPLEHMCRDCKHYEREPDPNGFRPMSCYALKGKTHPVFGGDVFNIDAGLMRMTLCGWNDPKFWEPKK